MTAEQFATSMYYFHQALVFIWGVLVGVIYACWRLRRQP